MKQNVSLKYFGVNKNFISKPNFTFFSKIRGFFPPIMSNLQEIKIIFLHNQPLAISSYLDLESTEMFTHQNSVRNTLAPIQSWASGLSLSGHIQLLPSANLQWASKPPSTLSATILTWDERFFPSFSFFSATWFFISPASFFPLLSFL